MDVSTARRILRDDLADATVKSQVAAMKLRTATESLGDIADASAELALAQRRMARAVERLTDLIIRGRIPDDLRDDEAKSA